MDSARNTLQKLMAGVLNRFPAEEVPLQSWPFVCGKQVAQRTQAVAFAAGVLRVEVPDEGWRATLEGLAPKYLAGLNQYSATRVERIEFAVPGAPASRAKPRRRTAVDSNEPAPSTAPAKKPQRKAVARRRSPKRELKQE
jgi:predicted nucleic acid-binding Zn ribbon protein